MKLIIFLIRVMLRLNPRPHAQVVARDVAFLARCRVASENINLKILIKLKIIKYARQPPAIDAILTLALD